jgi:hypothetical protein
MALLKKEQALFERDENGEFIPQRIVLETDAKEEVLVKPMSRGAVRKLFSEARNNETTTDQDKEIILNYCVDPKFEESEVDCMKPYLSNAIAVAILKASGVSENVNKGEHSVQKK